MRVSVSKVLKSNTVKEYNFPVSYVDPESVVHSFLVFSDDQFRQIVKQLFGQRFYNDWEPDSTETDAVNDFIATFDQWRSSRQDTYARRMYALSLHYDPLENYHSNEIQSASNTHGERVEQSFDNRKDTRQDDSSIERTYTNYKETTTDDSYVEHTNTNRKDVVKDDTYVEHTNTNRKDVVKDDTQVTRSYSNYQESMGIGAQTITHNVSADDSSTFSPASEDVNGQRSDTKGISGSYTDSHSNTNGVVTEYQGSTKDQNGFDTLGHVTEYQGSTRDQNGCTNGLERSTSGSYKDTHGFTNGDVLTKSGKEIEAHSGTDTSGYNLERWGNIGVTTSQQMLASDLDFLKFDIVMTAIKEFIGQYTYMCGEVD